MRQQLRPLGLFAGLPVFLVLVTAPQFAETLGAARANSQDVHPHLGGPHGALIAEKAAEVQEKVRSGSVMRREAQVSGLAKQDPRIEDDRPTEDEVVDQIVDGTKDDVADAEKEKEGEASKDEASDASKEAKGANVATVVDTSGGSSTIKDASQTASSVSPHMQLSGVFQDASMPMPMPQGSMTQPQIMQQPMMMHPPMMQQPMMMQPPMMQQPMMMPMPQGVAQPQAVYRPQVIAQPQVVQPPAMMQPQVVQTVPRVVAQAPCSQGAAVAMQPQAVAQVQQVMPQPQAVYRPQVIAQPQVVQPPAMMQPQVPHVVAQTPCSMGAGAVMQPQAVAQVQQVPHVVAQTPCSMGAGTVMQPQAVAQVQQVAPLGAGQPIAESADGTLKVMQVTAGGNIQSAAQEVVAAPVTTTPILVGNIVKQVQKQEQEEEEAALEKEIVQEHVGTTSKPKEESDFVMVLTFGLIFMVGLAAVGYGMYASTSNSSQRPDAGANY